MMGGGEWVVKGKRGIRRREWVVVERLEEEEKGINIEEKERKEERIHRQEYINHYIPLHYTLSVNITQHILTSSAL
jgi:hypothetical protein